MPKVSESWKVFERYEFLYKKILMATAKQVGGQFSPKQDLIYINGKLYYTHHKFNNLMCTNPLEHQEGTFELVSEDETAKLLVTYRYKFPEKFILEIK